MLSCVQLFAAPWTVAHQVPLSRAFSSQEYWIGLSFPPPRDLPNSGIKPASLVCLLHWQADSLPLVPPGKLLLFKKIHTMFLPLCLIQSKHSVNDTCYYYYLLSYLKIKIDILILWKEAKNKSLKFRSSKKILW